MIRSTVTAKGQTTLPRPVREALEVGPGDRVLWLVTPEGVRLVKAQPVARLAGRFGRGSGAPVSLEAMEAAVAAGAGERPEE